MLAIKANTIKPNEPQRFLVSGGTFHWKDAAEYLSQDAGVPEEVRSEIQLDLFVHQWEWYMKQVSEWEKHHGPSPIVFAHNDAQYGNLLRLRKINKEVSDHQQVSFIRS